MATEGTQNIVLRKATINLASDADVSALELQVRGTTGELAAATGLKALGTLAVAECPLVIQQTSAAGARFQVCMRGGEECLFGSLATLEELMGVGLTGMLQGVELHAGREPASEVAYLSCPFLPFVTVAVIPVPECVAFICACRWAHTRAAG